MSIYQQLEEYKRTKSIKLAADIIENLKNYRILTRDEFANFTEMAAKYQAVTTKHKKGAGITNKNLTPQKLSDRNRKVAIARWNKVKESKLIKDIK